MGIFLIVFIIGCSTVIWPVNRWVVKSGGKPQVFCLWMAITSILISSVLSLILKQNLFQPVVWYIGIMIGCAYAFGFCMVVLYCLKIGPTGPTVALNNMGLVWPVMLGVFWLQPKEPTALLIGGLMLVVCSLILFGVGSKEQDKGIGKTVTTRWLVWALVGCVLAGISMSGQLFGNIYAKESPFAVVFSLNVVTFIILATLVFSRKEKIISKKEIIPGIVIGITQTTGIVATMASLRYFGADIIFPFTVAGPIIIVLLLGQIIYKERLTFIQWAACVLGVAGLLGLSLSR